MYPSIHLSIYQSIYLLGVNNQKSRLGSRSGQLPRRLPTYTQVQCLKIIIIVITLCYRKTELLYDFFRYKNDYISQYILWSDLKDIVHNPL